jgi:predicted DNA-binding protein
MLVMKKPKSQKKATTDKHKYPAWGIRIPLVYRRQLKKLAEQTRRREVEEVKIALEEYLSKHDLWPASKDSQ